MLTTEENELLTRVGPGTPCGELFRRYWQPVGTAAELTDEQPTKFVRILGEDLVLFRDGGGRVGLLEDHCSHRGASLVYGRVEERGIACAYHGWLYDVEGNCLETPAEPADSKLHLTVKHTAYPVREYCGLYWAYMGPAPAPVLPRIDIAEAGPIKAVGVMPVLECNWLQFVEQNVDQAHVFLLHQDTGQRQGAPVSNTTRGRIDELETLEYTEVPFGIKRRQVRTNGYDETDLVVFPSTLRIYNQFSVKVPIDDARTAQYHVYIDLDPENSEEQRRNGGVEYYFDSAADGKSPPDATHPAARYRMDRLRFQDFTVLETQGPIAVRERERLGTSDRGVALFRTILAREIKKVQEGQDPIGVVREGDDDLIDTYIQSYIAVARKFPPGASRWR